MNPKISVPNLQEIANKSQEVYDKIADEEIKANEGKYIAIEAESGKYFIGETKEKTISLAKKKYPKKIIFIRRIGNVEKIAFCSSSLFNRNNNYAHIL